ncbi:hypothetical protein [Maledivibacter halophilus]|uniref:DUF3311 domain-containing protein n=1 Tax=Maledivibacter halophilus TaxID=36842 RepID=A0A1T5IC96_9FIRM|nr:hypothetical protein [Maledivibacter halophilus]SKC36769.1 hypothetical protein SAMN02194393_00195 [Maledivibacter halophilus]
MKISKGEKVIYSIFILCLIMLNPPVLNIANNYAKTKPLTFNFPTLWIWLQIWYLVAIITFLVGAIKIKNWKKDY